MENIATVINDFDNEYKAFHKNQAPSYFFDCLIRARDAGYQEAKQEWKEIYDKRETYFVDELRQLNEDARASGAG